MGAGKRKWMLMVIVTVLLMADMISPDGVSANAGSMGNDNPTISFDEKTPEEYTLEEYEKLTPQQQDAFFLWFDSIEAFEAWMAEVAPPMPWEEENRNPADYTWDEYNALTREQQEAFIDSFESVEDFEYWMENTRPEEISVMPWERDGKKPDEYTWAEYILLTPTQKDSFVAWFGGATAFEAWLEEIKAEGDGSENIPWEDNGKKPVDYTWADFEALTIAQQSMFTEWFADMQGFETWMANAKANGQTDLSETWNGTEKTPDEYTWEEFEALTIAQQDEFIEWFGDIYAFEAWMYSVNPDMNDAPVIPWANDKKQPDAYSAEDFEELTAYQQCMFFLWFETEEAFDHWAFGVSLMKYEATKNTSDEETTSDTEDVERSGCDWNEFEQMTSEQKILYFKGFASGEDFSAWVDEFKPEDVTDEVMPWTNTKKQPTEYTWDEYAELPIELQDAFYAWFETSELFEEWMMEVADREVLISLGLIEQTSDPSSAHDNGSQNDGNEESRFPCPGRVIKDRVNIRKECNTQSAVVGMVEEMNTEVTVKGIAMEGDTLWYWVIAEETEGYIRGDLMELVHPEGE